jgi:uncharacterized protein (TIGR02001 family)
MFSTSTRFATLAVIAAFHLSTPAFAQDATAATDPKPTIDASFNLGIVSDYRFRGVSLSNDKLAVQPSVTITHKSGAYVALWGSNIADNGGDNIELDTSLGYAHDIGALSLDAGVIGYFYPGASGYNYGEGYASLGTKVGPGTVKVSAAYAPKQDNIGGADNVYVGVSGTLPLGAVPLSLNASFGIEDGAFGGLNGRAKHDWSFGADFDIEGFTAGIKYIDTARTGNNTLANGNIVFSLSRSF